MLSVIIPTYNRAALLFEAVHSVLAQDYLSPPGRIKNFELLVVDDGSTDNTQDVIREFGNRISCLFQDHRGVSAARNRGIERSRGDYVAFLDSDDLWEKEKLSVQMSYMKAFPGAAMCYTEEKWIRNGRFVNPRKRHRKYSGWVFDKVLPLCLLSLSSALFRREVFDGIGVFDESLPACEDYDFSLRLAHAYPWHLIGKPLIVKRGGHPDQLSRKFHSMDVFRVRALEKALTLNLRPEEEILVRKEIVRKCRVLLSGLERRERLDEVRKYEKIVEKYDKEEG